MRFKNKIQCGLLLLCSVWVCGCAVYSPMVRAPIDEGPIGIYHQVKSGETLSGISSNYGIASSKIVSANHLSDSNGVEPGQLLYIPFKPRSSMLNMPTGYRKPLTNNEKVFSNTNRLATEGHFIWPIMGSVITRFGVKKNDFVTNGIDIRAKNGAQVYAVKNGRITFAGAESNGKNKMVVVDHGSGIESIYAHNSEILVKVGESVKQHDIISRIHSTGQDETFLHFEIRKNGRPVDPLEYLN